MKKIRYKLFSYLFIDHLAAQEELNTMARRGWELEGFLGPFARFRPTERTDLVYFLDWYDPREENDEDYLQLCEDAGWELKEQWKYCSIYGSKPGASPAPIQTDPALEYQRFREKVLRRKGLKALGSLGYWLLELMMIGVLIAVTLSVGSDLEWDWFALILQSFVSSNALTLLLLCLPFLLIMWAVYHLFLALRLRRWKRAIEEGESAPSGSKAVQVWKILSLLRFFCLLLCQLLFWGDALLNHVGSWVYPAVAVVFGGMTALEAEKTEKGKRNGGLLICGFGIVSLLCLLLNAPLRSVFPGRLPPVPVMAEHKLVWEKERADTFGGSSTEWVETVPGEILTFRAKAAAWRSDTLAQWSLQNMTKDMTPLEGYSDVWIDPATADQSLTTYVVALDNTQLHLICRSEAFPSLLPEILRWMEQIP